MDDVVQVGSVMETEEERGVAHLIEHLAFRASKTCPQEFDLVKEASQKVGRHKTVVHYWAHFEHRGPGRHSGNIYAVLLARLVLPPLSYPTLDRKLLRLLLLFATQTLASTFYASLGPAATLTPCRRFLEAFDQRRSRLEQRERAA